MARKYQYYNVFIVKNGIATRLYFTDFLDQVRRIDWKNRLRKINHHPTALFEMKIPSAEQLFRIAAIGKYRQNVKPYTGDINTATARMINDDVIEMTTIVASPTARTVLVEYNLYGSKAKDIQDYFYTFLHGVDSRNSWEIIFDPIPSNKSIADIRTSNDIREIDLKINVGSGMFDQLVTIAQTPAQRNSLFGKVISISQSIVEETEAPVINLSFGKGRKRSINLAANEILNLIELLDIDNNDAIESCKVTYKDPSTGTYMPLELKSVGVMSDIILEGEKNNPSWEFVGDSMFDKYISLNRPASTVFAQKVIQFIDETMPTLARVPGPDYFVPIEEGTREETEGDAEEIVS